MSVKERIGNRIKEVRKAAGLTIKELAEKTGKLSAARIGNWEQGTRSPGPTEARMLAEHLNVSASYLLCLTDNLHGELSHNANTGMRHIPVLDMKEAPYVKEIIKGLEHSANKSIVIDGFNKFLNADSLFAVVLEDNSMEPVMRSGSVVVINSTQFPKPGDYVLAHVTSKKQIILRKYGEADNCLYQLLAHNDLWATITIREEKEVEVLGIVVEIRQYL